ncbi:hypothetical protein EIP91_004692 [Steccherinum ochraceum]|uniref:protein-tyrosine-phosphatase n=1 Tax=Steccherinum ochraceum TaxID=92696 RepID=A0A4R0R8C6_9APHY|nr:hypothetical protein EIP91_004692 [Steccherinum ochraceum]
MDPAATPRPSSSFPRRRGPPSALRIHTPVHTPNIALALSDSSAPPSSISSAASDSDSFVYPPPSKGRARNMKKLSLTLPSAQSSTNSLAIPSDSAAPSDAAATQPSTAQNRRRPSVISLPNASTAALLHRKDEDLDGGSPTAPYLDGPIQILPGIWLGSQDNVRDWATLRERGIRSILNVAQEVTTVFDSMNNQPPLRPFMSTPDLSETTSSADPTFYPAHGPSGRPGMHYLKMPWSHGQSNLVTEGFPAAMSFVDRALERGDGVLIHCQCGVSRSATLVIALVMRASAQCSPAVPPEVWALQGMQGAYAFVKEKSRWVGPNMSLIYQLLDYERTFKAGGSPTPSDRSSSIATEEEEWSRRRQAMEEEESENDRESVEVMQEARALDKAMEDRLLARKSSASSVGSSNGIGMGQAWRNRYGSSRKRTGSIASVVTSGSVLSEDLMEEDEEAELLRTGGGFTSSTEPTEDDTSSMSSGDPNSRQTSPCSDVNMHPPSLPTVRLPPPSAPAHKHTFSLPPTPATAIRTTFDISSRTPTKPKARRRPPPLFGTLPPVPSSPVSPSILQVPARTRTESRKPQTPPAFLRKISHGSTKSTSSASTSTSASTSSSIPLSATPSQTLFVFPPSPTNATTLRTPSTMTLTSNSSFPFPLSTPRVSTFRSAAQGGKRRSFIGLGAPATPTVASSRVDARGWVGMS